MKTIILKRKGQPSEEVLIYDDLITGLLSPGPYVIALFGKGIWPLAGVISEFSFPVRDGEAEPRIISYTRGHEPKLIKEVEFYNDTSFMP